MSKDYQTFLRDLEAFSYFLSFMPLFIKAKETSRVGKEREDNFNSHLPNAYQVLKIVISMKYILSFKFLKEAQKLSIFFYFTNKYVRVYNLRNLSHLVSRKPLYLQNISFKKHMFNYYKIIISFFVESQQHKIYNEL